MKERRKVTSYCKYFLQIVIIFACFSFMGDCSVQADTTTYSSYVDGLQWNYQIKSDNTIAVYPSKIQLKKHDSVTVPSSLDGYTVTEIMEKAFSDNTSLGSVVIPSTVTKIDDNAFLDCTYINSITVPDSVTSIGNYAFSGCGFLKTINIPSGLTYLGEWAFYDSGLTSVTIPSSITELPKATFYKCSHLVTVNLPSNMTQIDGYAFYYCTSLKSITLPSSLKELQNQVFRGDESLQTCVIPSGVTSIGGSCFLECSSLLSITLPYGVTEIPAYLCSQCTKLEEVKILGQVESIGNYAFENCVALTSINVPDSVKIVGSNAFSNDYRAVGLNIPASAVSIGYMAYYGCDGITNLVIPDSVNAIGVQAFYGASCISTVVLPDSVTALEFGTFDCGDNLLNGTVYYKGNKSQWTVLENTADEYNEDLFQAKYRFYLAPQITSQPSGSTYNVGNATNTLSIAAIAGEDNFGNTNVGTLSYQWYKNSVNSNSGGSMIFGATSASYTPSSSEAGTNYYYCVVTNTFNGITASETSETALITVQKQYYTVSFDSCGGSSISSQTVSSTDCAVKPADPTRDGYVFGGWYISSDYSSTYNFNTTVSGNMTLYAKWEVDYSSLATYVNMVSGKLENEAFREKFTDSSLTNLEDTLSSAKSMVENKTAATPSQVSSMLENLKSAYSSLIVAVGKRPNLCISDGVVTAVLDGNKFVIHQYTAGRANNESKFTALYDAEETKKGSPESTEVTITASGVYTFYVTDEFDYPYYLTARFKNGSQDNSFVDTSLLNYEITVAQALYDSMPVNDAGLAIGASYTDSDSKSVFYEAIQAAIAVIDSETSQDEVDEALTNLQAAETVFKNTIKTVEWKCVTVSGSTIRIAPSNGCTITKVAFNVNEDGTLKDGIYNSWSGFTSDKYDVKSSDLIWDNVSDGVYTFIIWQQDAAGNLKATYEVAAVETEQDAITSAKEFLSELTVKAQALLDSVKTESEAADGDTYTTDVKYNALKEQVTSVNTLVENEQAEYADAVNLAYSMYTSMLKVKQFTYVKGTNDIGELSVSEANGTITISHPKLERVIIARGSYEDWSTFKNANYTHYVASSGTCNITLSYNDVYTLLIRYADDTSEYYQVTVSDIETPVTATHSGQTITVDYTGNAQIIQTGYVLGESQDISSSDYLFYDGLKTELTVIGNGTYTIYLKDCNGEEYFVNLEVTDQDAPVILIYNNELRIYDNGYEFTTTAFAEGKYQSWEEMYDDAVYFSCDEVISTDEFTSGDYTFYFKDASGNQYLLYVTI